MNANNINLLVKENVKKQIQSIIIYFKNLLKKINYFLIEIQNVKLVKIMFIKLIFKIKIDNKKQFLKIMIQ